MPLNLKKLKIKELKAFIKKNKLKIKVTKKTKTQLIREIKSHPKYPVLQQRQQIEEQREEQDAEDDEPLVPQTKPKKKKKKPKKPKKTKKKKKKPKKDEPFKSEEAVDIAVEGATEFVSGDRKEERDKKRRDRRKRDKARERREQERINRARDDTEAADDEEFAGRLEQEERDRQQEDLDEQEKIDDMNDAAEDGIINFTSDVITGKIDMKADGEKITASIKDACDESSPEYSRFQCIAQLERRRMIVMSNVFGFGNLKIDGKRMGDPADHGLLPLTETEKKIIKYTKPLNPLNLIPKDNPINSVFSGFKRLFGG